jgi:hypothetical protein
MLQEKRGKQRGNGNLKKGSFRKPGGSNEAK